MKPRKYFALHWIKSNLAQKSILNADSLLSLSYLLLKANLILDIINYDNSCMDIHRASFNKSVIKNTQSVPNKCELEVQKRITRF